MRRSKAEEALREKCPDTEFFLVHIQSKYGKIWTRKTPHLDTFHTVKVASIWLVSIFLFVL